MEEIIPIPSHDERRAALEIIAQFGVPAYLRRAKRVETAFADLIDRQRARRDELLNGVRLHLYLLLDLAGSLDAVQPFVPAEELETFRTWVADFGLLEGPATRAAPWRLRRALRDLAESVARFNRRWFDHIAQVDLTEVNDEREGYNRWYLLEKECAVGVIWGRQRFEPLPPVTHDDVLAALPPLSESAQGA